MQARRKSIGLITALRTSDNTISIQNTNLDLDDGLSGEQRARVECVLRIINNFIEKLQVSLIIPHIITASNELIEEDLKDVGLQISTLRSLGKTELKSKIQDSLLSNENVFHIQQFIEKNFGQSKLWGKWLILLTTQNQNLIADFTTLYEITRERLSKSALFDLTKEKKLSKLQQNVAVLDKTVKEMSEKLRKQKILNLWKLGARAALIQKYEENLAYQKWENNLRIKQEIVRSSKSIYSLQESNNLQLAIFEEEAMEKRIIYNKLLQEDLSIEKYARAEKKKLLFQLQTYIRKYDQNVGHKIKENLKLQENYAAKKGKFDEFIIKFQKQQTEYFAIVEQKEKEEQLLFEQKLMVFMMGRAARAIQIRWRRFRRDQRKKSKKKGKGKKK